MIKKFFLKIVLEFVNLVCNNQFAFLVAKQFKIFDAVFVMYPANQRFADHYTFGWRQRLIRWKPFIVGFITHPSGKRTLSFAISSHLDEVGGQNSPYDLRQFHYRVEKIAELLGGVSTHFAGTLPSRLTELKVNRGKNKRNERVATVDNVVRAIFHVRSQLRHTNLDPIIVLGSKGYIGREVMRCLGEHLCTVVGVDLEDTFAGGSCMYEFPNRPHLVVNITVPEAVNDYIDGFSAKTVLLNEVFPQPDADVIREINAKGAKAYHLSGVSAIALPSFPFEYQGAVPCCAALQERYDVKVIEL